MKQDSPDDSAVKNLSMQETHVGSISGSGRSPGGGNGNPLQSSSLENPMDRGSWRGGGGPWGRLQSVGLQRAVREGTQAHTHNVKWEEAGSISRSHEVWQTGDKPGSDGLLMKLRRHFGSKSWQSKTIVLGPGREVYWDHIFSSWSSPLCSPWHHDKHQDYFHT